MADDVVADATVDGPTSGSSRRTVLRFAWSRHDPLAVRLELCAEPNHPALPRGRWSVLRDFLRYGLDERTGDGDVRIAPVDNGETIGMELYAEGRGTSVTVPARTVRDFLDETEAIVPSGEERTEAMLDDLVARLLDS